MGFFDQLKDKASQAGEKAGAALKDAKSRMSEGMADAKAKMDEHKALAAEAKAPIEGSIARYQVVYLGGFPKKPNGKMDPTAFGFNIMPDSFIFKPELELTLMEPTGKRVEFLKYACGQLGLTGVEFAKERAEEAARKVWREQFDLASARAVAALPMLAEYCLPLVKVGGSFLAMKGASGEEELNAARGAIKKLGGEYKETRTLHLPGGDTRTLILCKKISQTPTAYPRNGGKIAKSPLK